jgi:hypothetical protein
VRDLAPEASYRLRDDVQKDEAPAPSQGACEHYGCVRTSDLLTWLMATWRGRRHGVKPTANRRRALGNRWLTAVIPGASLAWHRALDPVSVGEIRPFPGPTGHKSAMLPQRRKAKSWRTIKTRHHSGLSALANRVHVFA